MFWNSEFLDSSPSHIDVLLQLQTVKLSDILFEEDLLQELKTSNVNLANFLNRPEIIAELVDNITQITEKDCSDKLLYSRVHAAYISCEILTGGSTEIFAALMNHPDSLSKVISCLTCPPQSSTKPNHQQSPINQENNKIETDINEKVNEEEKEEAMKEKKKEEKVDQIDDRDIVETKNENKNENKNEIENEKSPKDDVQLPLENDSETIVTKVVPQKAALVSKLISNIHSLAPANLSCHISQDILSFSRLVNLLVQNIDVSGSLEILNTLIKRTTPPELRYVFCEVLSKLNFVYNLIDVMTLSNVEDKQRNACQLLCDIIVIGRQEASEQVDSGSMAQDMLEESLESSQAVHLILNQMFSENMRNTTAIICGMKVLQTLIEPNKSTSDVEPPVKTNEQIYEEIEKHLVNFHELLLNPPKQEPIKTTFGIIQKPLGYMRLEVVNLIRALISTNSRIIIKKLVELKTMNVIIDLFIEYSWNNLLHTQVEQALCLIIANCRFDDDLSYQSEMHRQLNNHQQSILLSSSLSDEQQCTTTTTTVSNSVVANTTDTLALEQNNICPSENLNNKSMDQTNEKDNLNELEEQPKEVKEEIETNNSSKNDEVQQLSELRPQISNNETQPHDESTSEKQSKLHQSNLKQEPAANEIPSRALLSQLLNECDLIGRLLLPTNSNNNNNNYNNINNNNNNNNSSSGSSGSTNNINNNNNNIISNTNTNNLTVHNSNLNIENGDTNNVEINRICEVETERQRRRNGEKANFGHIIQMINSISINDDLDTIRDHLETMKVKRPDLYNTWHTFVMVDVASFKGVSIFYDAQSAGNNVNHRYANTQHHQMNNNHSNESSAPHNNSSSLALSNSELRYMSFSKECILPTLNMNVLPRNRRSSKFDVELEKYMDEYLLKPDQSK